MSRPKTGRQKERKKKRRQVKGTQRDRPTVSQYLEEKNISKKEQKRDKGKEKKKRKKERKATETEKG